MATVTIGGDDPDAFLANAVAFCNDRLRGTLNATILVDGKTLRAHRPAVESAIDDLRYGTVGLNLWGAAGFPLGVTPWGAFPGHTIEDIGSDKRFVLNTKSLDLSDVKRGDSICVNGVCLTVVGLEDNGFSTDVSVETLSCTTFNELVADDKVNLEKALQLSSRLSGHMVAGHVDGKGIVQKKYTDARSEHFEIKYPAELGK